MGSLSNEQHHGDELHSPRPVSLGLVVLAGWSFLLSTVGQAYFLFTSPVLSSKYQYISSADMIGFLVAFLSIVGGSWLATLAIPSKIRLNTEERSPILDTFLNEKRAVEMELKAERDAYIRSAQATYIPYFIAGNICLGGWSLLSIGRFHIASQLALLANLIIQNYAIFIALHNWRHPELGMSKETWRMHVLSKGNAALAVLSLWTNSGILEKMSTPTFPEMLNNGTIFILMAVGGGPDPTLGMFLLYDLVALAYGTGAVREWQVAFQYTSLVVVFVLAWDLSSIGLRKPERDTEETEGTSVVMTAEERSAQDNVFASRMMSFFLQPAYIPWTLHDPRTQFQHAVMFEPTKTLPRIVLNLFLVTFFLTINNKLWSYILGLFGHEIHIQSISVFPVTFRGITYRYRSKNFSLSAGVGSIQCRFHLPTPRYPQLLTIILQDVFYKKGNLTETKADKTVVIVWFLPVFFRQTSSSLITVKAFGCVVDNVNVDEEAWWARAIRANITETILQGETIRLHDLKTKLWLYEPIAPQTEAAKVDIGGESMGRTVGVEEKGKAAEDNEQDDEVLDDGPVKAREVLQEQGDEHNHEARARVHAIHWMLHNHHNKRVYSFGSFNAEVRRPWGAPPYPAMPERVGVLEKVELPQGSMVLKITDSTWTKLPRVEKDADYFKSSTPSQLLRSILSFPGYILRTFRDPMSIVDIEAKDVEITYREFRLRDAEMFKHALEAAKTAYGTQVPRFKQIVSDWTWALWCDGVTRALSND